MGYIANSSIYNLMKIDSYKRTSDHMEAILAYLRKVSVAYRKMEHSLLEALVEKIQPHAFK